MGSGESVDLQYTAPGTRKGHHYKSWRRFLRSSSKSVTVPSTILPFISDSSKLLKGEGGGKPCCIRLKPETPCEMVVPMLNKSNTTASPAHTPRPTNKVTTPPTIWLTMLS